MEILRNTDQLPRFKRGVALSIGKFDGLHLGHIGILQKLLRKARQYEIPSLLFTFDRSPVEILAPEKATVPLCDIDQKIDLISAFHPDYLIFFPVTRSFLAMPADRFLDQIVRREIGASVLVEGESFTFGAKRGGNSAFLQKWCRDHSIDLSIVPPVAMYGAPLSSSRIRALLAAGEVGIVRAMLKRPYRISGVVADGDHRGRTLGFPTANLSQVKTILPKPGLYAARALVDGRFFPAAVNLGGNPTFGVNDVKIEVHILDWSGNIYGERLSVDFISRLRDILPFGSREALLAAMNRDIASVRSLWAKWICSDTMI